MKETDPYIHDENLSEEELDALTQKLLRAKFDKEKKEAWAKRLAEEHGVQRKKETPPTPPTRRRFLWMITAAAVVFLLVWAFYWMRTDESFNPVQLAEVHLQEPFPNPVVQRGDENADAIRLTFVQAYNEGDYPKAIELGQQLKQDENAKTADQFFLALSYLYDQQTTHAIDQLMQLQTNPSDDWPYQEESHWFLALAHLKNSDVEKAKTLLQSIIDQNEWQAQSAADLIERISTSR